MSQLNKEQIQEWTENPITLLLKKAAEDELEEIRTAPLSINLIRGEPGLTQENLIENVTRELEWQLFIDLLDGDWSEIEEDDE
jgi:hypothetical protein